MRVTKAELDNYGLLENLPSDLKQMSDGEYFVFYYSVDELNSKLIIHETGIVREPNVSLYRGISDKYRKYKMPVISVGFFPNTFETRDGLFYQFLRTYNESKKVSEFYQIAMEQDKISDVNVSTNSVNDIKNSDDFRNTISYFCNTRLQPIMFAYDMVNTAFQNRLSKSLYGEMLKRVVNLIKYEGGVLPEIGGRFRFMVIGEKAKLTEEQKAKLDEAKFLIRSLVSIDKVYLLTGWALGEKDGRWRTNIADNEAAIIRANLYSYNGSDLYVPSGQSVEETIQYLSKPTRMVSGGYKGNLSQLVYHPTLYKYYPKLALLPVAYYYGDTVTGKSTFYFSPEGNSGYIIIKGNEFNGDSLSILLHEIQHAVEDYEGFAKGGNEFIAKFVASVGSNAVKNIFACINRMERYYREYLLDDDVRVQLLQLIEETFTTTDILKYLKEELVTLLKDESNYYTNYKTINYYLVIFISELGDITMNDIVTFLESKFPSSIVYVLYELLENVSIAYTQSKNYQDVLLSQGYREEDIKNILFKAYENLYGEIESRSVQSSRFVESQFKNYFSLTKWEIDPLKQITIIDGTEEIIDCKSIVAAVEDKNGEYVLHFTKQKSSIPYLHELGHIVHDGLRQLGYEDSIKSIYANNLRTQPLDEWFVDCFLSYLYSRMDDAKVREDFAYFIPSSSIEDEKAINKIFDELFMDAEANDRLFFAQKLLQLI